MIAAIVLAAGKSERMGYPKALLRFKGKTFLERILEAIAEAGIENVVVVVGHHEKEIRQTAPSSTLVFNARYEQGMGTSVQAGIRALPQDAAGAVIFLVDHPLIDAGTIRSLIRSLRRGCIVLPVHGGRRGHPIAVAADIFPEILGLSPDQGLHVVVRREPQRVVEVPVDSPEILRDIDTPDQFEKLLGENR